MALTELAIKNLKPREKAYRVADGGGLMLEVAPTGSKLWRWRYYYQGKEQMLALGKYPALSLAAVRKSRDAARELLDSGKHPSREKKAAKQRRMTETDNTFESVARYCLQNAQKGLNAKYAAQNLTRIEQHVLRH